jgi:steroid 5-alpha reductase family enzyme
VKAKQMSIIGILVSVALASAVGVAGGAGSVTVGGVPVFFLCGIIAFAIQWLMFIPAYLYQTEKYYDLTGSLTYISLTLLSLDFARTLDGGRLMIAAMVMIWAVRLGAFLFARIRADGHDVRFDKIKPNFLRFLMTWTLQGLWVFLTFSAGLAAITSTEPHPIGLLVIVGGLIWVTGFAIEVIADNQKGRFRSVAANRDTFINHGLWKYSRHPNYFGEILLWLGIAVAAFPVLSGWQYVTLVSPVFVYLLLTQVSGVKMLEARALRRWGDNEAYQAYLKRTPALVLNPWAGS